MKEKNPKDITTPRVKASIHRRVLTLLNNATRLQDLMYLKPKGLVHEDHPEELEAKTVKLLDKEIAIAILDYRDGYAPFGFRHLREVLEIERLDFRDLGPLLHHLGDSRYGRWDTLPYDIVRPGNITVEVAHAALLHTGKVLFIPADFYNAGWATPIWDPSDEGSPVFEYPTLNPDYALFCGGHSFLSDGRLLVVGGGGDRIPGHPDAKWGFKFNPVMKEWTRTSESMNHGYRWYPTAVTLGDMRVVITCGDSHGDMEYYDEATDKFVDVTGGDTKRFDNLYPGLHLLPNHLMFYSRTGWGSATHGAPLSNDSSAYFGFSDMVNGAWTNITSSTVNRCKGMSVMILRSSFPTAQVLVVGGSDASGEGINSAEIIDLSVLSASSAWAPTGMLPDTLNRRQCSAVLLPDSTVFVAGGVTGTNSASMLYNPETNAWSPMDELPSRRGYHSVSLLLPNGKVMMAGGTHGEGNTGIEVFSPPYLFRGPRPTISFAPRRVRHGQTFSIETPDADRIVRAVLVRPMAVTHQADTEQRVIEMQIDYAQPNRLVLTAPTREYPHSLAPQGFYMLFILNRDSVPSVANWIYLGPEFFFAVYSQGDPGNGIGGYDLKSASDRAFVFDYDGSGKLDHLALYRPGTGTIWILKNTAGTFSPVYAQGDPGSGIGGYDLKSAADRAFAVDYDGSGRLDHLALYRPGTGTIWLLRKT